jgi:hypothetical protein
MQAKNIKEFKELILRYESITLDEIEEKFTDGFIDVKSLTGFGNPNTCSLCIPIKMQCLDCIYNKTGSVCRKGINSKTYRSIALSDHPLQLKEAYIERAKHMRKILKEYYDEN